MMAGGNEVVAGFGPSTFSPWPRGALKREGLKATKNHKKITRKSHKITRKSHKITRKSPRINKALH
jgi:hypothetical protein